MAGLPPEGEETSEPLKYKTWVLKVSIHCEGCKRKVKRILHTVDGVYTIDVDAKQHKVTVTGNVDSNTLLKKLEKSGKHAEMWPDSQKNPTKSKKNKNLSSQNSQEQPENQNNPTVEGGEKVAVVNSEQPENQNSISGNENNSNTQEEKVKEVRFEGNIPVAGDEIKPPENNPSAGNNGGGSGGKKKKKKGHKGNNTTTENSNNKGESAAQVQQPNGVPQSTESPPSHPGQAPEPNPNPNPSPVSMSPPRHHGINNRVYEYPPSYYAPPPPPVYGVSYSTAYPTSSYTASYYSAPQPYSYAYVQDAHVEPPPPSDWYPASSQPPDSFELFSDENPNACSIM